MPRPVIDVGAFRQRLWVSLPDGEDGVQFVLAADSADKPVALKPIKREDDAPGYPYAIESGASPTPNQDKDNLTFNVITRTRSHGRTTVTGAP